VVVHRAKRTNNPQVANKKQRDNVAADAELKARREARALQDQENQAPQVEGSADTTEGPTDLLAAEEDEDVIF